MALPAVIATKVVPAAVKHIVKPLVKAGIKGLNAKVSRRTALKLVAGGAGAAVAAEPLYDAGVAIKSGITSISNLMRNDDMRGKSQKSALDVTTPTTTVTGFSGEGGSGPKEPRGRKPRKEVDPKRNPRDSALSCFTNDIVGRAINRAITNDALGDLKYVCASLDIAPGGISGSPTSVINSYLSGVYYTQLTQLYNRARFTSSLNLPSIADVKAHFNAAFALQRLLYYIISIRYLREEYNWRHKCSEPRECGTEIPNSIIDMAQVLGINTGRWEVIWSPRLLKAQNFILPPFFQHMAAMVSCPFTMGSIDNIVRHIVPPTLSDNVSPSPVITEAGIKALVDTYITACEATSNVAEVLLSLLNWRLCFDKPITVLDDSPWHSFIWQNVSMMLTPAVDTLETRYRVNSPTCTISALEHITVPLYNNDASEWIGLTRNHQYNVNTAFYWNETTHAWSRVSNESSYGLGLGYVNATTALSIVPDSVHIYLTGDRMLESLERHLPDMYGTNIIQSLLQSGDGSKVTLNRNPQDRTICYGSCGTT